MQGSLFSTQNPRQLSWKLCALVFSPFFSPSTTQPLWCSWSYFSLQIKLVSKSWHLFLTIWFHLYLLLRSWFKQPPYLFTCLFITLLRSWFKQPPYLFTCLFVSLLRRWFNNPRIHYFKMQSYKVAMPLISLSLYSIILSC